MSKLNAKQWKFVRHNTVGIAIGLVVGLACYFAVFNTVLSQEVGTNSDSPSAQDNKTDVEGSDHIADKTKFFPRDHELAEGDPQTVWKDLQENDQLHIGRIVDLINTAEAWITQDGLGVLNEIYESVTDREVRAALFGSVIFAAAKENGYHDLFREAQEKLSNDELRHEFLWRVVRMWAPMNPVGAFAMASQIKDEYIRVEVLKSVAEIWAKTDTELLKEMLSTMPGPVAHHAEWMVMVATAEQSPTDAVTFLPDVANTPYERQLVTIIANHWKKSEVEGALKWALNHEFNKDSLRNSTLGSVLYEIAKTDLDRALKIAISKSVDEFGRGPEAYLVAQIAAKDIDQAIEILPRVRVKGNTRGYAYEVIGRYLARDYDFDRAVEVGEEITFDVLQKAFYDSILPRWALRDPSDLAKKIPFLPTKYLRSRAAMYLIDTESYRLNSLTERQLAQARAYISPQDWKTLAESTNGNTPIDIDSIELHPVEFPFANIDDPLENYLQIRSSF